MDSLLGNTLKKMDHDVIAAALKRPCDDDHELKAKKQKIEENSDEKINTYSGWTVPSHKFTIPSITLCRDKDGKLTLSPQQFYKEYISARKPIVIRGWKSLSDLDQLQKWSSNEYLIQKAGKERIMVEKRCASTDTFGQGNEVPMTFQSFLDLVADGNDMHYLTTQDVEANEDGRPDLMAPFMKALKDDFPLRPNLMGNLIPQNINMWMGNNKNGASSGLHHDYHDNLYLVLRGKKRFRLFSPDDAEYMYCRGDLVKVHPNGRINYREEVTTAYGADLKSDAAAKAARAKDEAEQRLIQAEAAVKEGKEGAQEELDEAERAMEEAMDALIDAEMGESDGDDGEEDDDDDCEVFDSEDEEHNGGLFSADNDEKDFVLQPDNDKKPPAPINGNENAFELEHEGRRLVDKTVKNPNNFSTVNHELLDNEEELRKKFPSMAKAKSAFCEVNEGDMLYLPASWFHEVTSFGGENQNGHLAFNYW